MRIYLMQILKKYFCKLPHPDSGVFIWGLIRFRRFFLLIAGTCGHEVGSQMLETFRGSREDQQASWIESSFDTLFVEYVTSIVVRSNLKWDHHNEIYVLEPAWPWQRRKREDFFLHGIKRLIWFLGCKCYKCLEGVERINVLWLECLVGTEYVGLGYSSLIVQIWGWCKITKTICCLKTGLTLSEKKGKRLFAWN